MSGPIVFILLLLIAAVGVWYAQSELNKVWEAQGSGGGLPQPAAEEPAAVEPERAELRPETPTQGPRAPSQPE